MFALRFYTGSGDIRWIKWFPCLLWASEFQGDTKFTELDSNAQPSEYHSGLNFANNVSPRSLKDRSQSVPCLCVRGGILLIMGTSWHQNGHIKMWHHILK